MDTALVIDWAREALRMAMLLGGPPLLAALAVGLLVGIGQTLTQMHEPVVAQVPRLVVVLLVILVALPWFLGCWIAYASDLIGTLPERLFSG
ncbi:MAG TPA: flagellar biosynthetic protein FliQ [Isosphaeraceae bacterium]|jgi:flagellar biosynthesis protein FliQ|nr:flagellar biosynthetic protein FliQ [Isosphaeraceae bacterium]